MAGVLLNVAPVKTVGKHRRCPPYRHQPMGFCLEATSLQRYVLASCMALQAWFEVVFDKMSKSDLNGTRGSMPCMSATAAYTQGVQLSKAPTFAKISRNAATVAVVQQDQQQVTPNIWLSQHKAAMRTQ